MSAILESLAGDELICITGFFGSPEGTHPSWETAREFLVGERVGYVGFRHDRHQEDHPSDWMVIFDAADGKRYAATQTYFVTEKCWEGLVRFFSESMGRHAVSR